MNGRKNKPITVVPTKRVTPSRMKPVVRAMPPANSPVPPPRIAAMSAPRKTPRAPTPAVRRVAPAPGPGIMAHPGFALGRLLGAALRVRAGGGMPPPLPAMPPRPAVPAMPPVPGLAGPPGLPAMPRPVLAAGPPLPVMQNAALPRMNPFGGARPLVPLRRRY